MPVNVTLKEARVPSGLLRGEAFDPAACAIDARVVGGPLELVHTIAVAPPAERRGLFGLPAGERASTPAPKPKEERTVLRNLEITVLARDLRRGVTVGINGRTGRDPEAGGTIAVNGSLTDVMTDESTFDLARGTLNAQATVADVPTAVVDAILRQQGKLAAALGPTLDGRFTADGFSTQAGTLAMNLTATNGQLAGMLRGAGGDFQVAADPPFSASLVVTDPFRTEILQRINPVLGDIEKTDRPIEFTMTGTATIPVESGVEKLNATLNIDVGNVDFDPAANVVSIMSVYEQVSGTIRGHISPIVAKAVNGVVACEPFVVTINQCTLTSYGTVNLVEKRVDARAETDLRCLTLALPGIREIRQVTDELDFAVPVLIHGPFGNVKKEVDPEIGDRIIKTGLERAIEKNLGGVLDDIFGGKKDK
ncbi:MAG: hypothetical protein ACYTGP_04120 [Planctomycetota bacterium]